MKKVTCFLMLLLSITGILYAQNNTHTSNEDKVFDVPEQEINKRFQIALDKGDKMQVELVDMRDLACIGNIDSLLKIFLKDIAPLKDSLLDELSVKRIDYVMEPPAAKKLRFKQFRPAGTSYLVQQGNMAALKLEQDTVHFIGMVPVGGKQQVHRFRISFFVNQLNNLAAYADGRLQAKLVSLRENVHSDWVKDDKGMMHIRKDYMISSSLSGGNIGAHNDYLAFNASVNIQNYKNYFVPSFSVGATAVTAVFSGKHTMELGAYWEPNFFFGRDSDGKLKTYRNDFVTLMYGVGPAKRAEGKKDPYLQFAASVGYLVHRSGDYFEKHSFRVGLGRISLLEGKTKIEPVVYFHEVFKGVTPGLRLTQSF
ncbi:hypothetical protein [Chitinophaga pinensis]|uniref:DUF3575 domain-containing protein n=1 Tax=Chitinophaga pinensis (strain ATCC 43595 / DSM 2588 / LMG 13176 / NBRC 15968 / NCIMB 11800 / UQM 2034) TaxID=485918 RepID=A0A979G2L0_CHIPD|nr:hypothetical protein [Chitinophaga pinensis]ACU59634.1 hypothetical protein Cpin_2142 [Chitinophaga pinensis DSM 2588]